MVLACVALPVVLALTGRSVDLPGWAVAQIETRLNRTIGATLAPKTALALGGAALTVGRDGAPRLLAQDLRLITAAGSTVAILPQLEVRLDPARLLRGELRLRRLRLTGAQVTLRRLADGRFDLDFGAETAGPPPANLAALLDRIEQVFRLPALSTLDRIEAEALTLTLDDRRAERVWQVGDGRVTVLNRPDELALSLGFGLVGGGSAPAQAEVTFVSTKASSAARITATVTGVAAADLAAQTPALAWLGVLDAPISGRLATTLDPSGHLTGTDGTLEIGAGALHPNERTRPVAFERAGLSFVLNTQAEELILTDLAVESRSLRLKASGKTRVPGLSAGLPTAFIGQVRIADLRIDPVGFVTEPVIFSEGAIDARLTLDPFRIDIGQVSLHEGTRRLIAKGTALAEPAGWNLSLDVALNEIRHDRLIALWPVALVPKTRAWLVDNLQQGLLFNVRGGVRLRPGQDPRLALNYDFADADVRFLRSLPPVRAAYGYSTIEDQTYTTVLDRGEIVPPEGGPIDVAGSVIRVPDVTDAPAQAEITLRTQSTLTAALSLLDGPPFGLPTKAGIPVDVAQGQADLITMLHLPLQARVGLPDVVLSVAGVLSNVTSDRLVKGRELRAGRLAVFGNNASLRIGGSGALGQAPFDVTWTQRFGPKAGGGSRIDGQVLVSAASLAEFGLRLPPQTVTGQSAAFLTMELPKGGGGTFKLESDLVGVSLELPALGLAKGPSDGSVLQIEGRLGSPAAIDRLRLATSNFALGGTVGLRAEGGLDVARFGYVQSADWLDVQAEVTGTGPGRPVAIAVTGGTVDLRRVPGGSARGADAPPLDVALDRLIVSDGIELTGFRGSFGGAGGLRGDFSGSVNGQAEVTGSIEPTPDGTAARIRSQDAGAVIAAAGIFGRVRGGTLDLTLEPRGPSGVYDGSASLRDIQVRDAPVLADLLGAISVVGLLDQLNDAGLAFSSVDTQFTLSPDRVFVTQGSAVGASLGVTLTGGFDTTTGGLDMQGVISPLYLMNGIGSVLTRPGEGLFGFNYALTGTAISPSVSVNPLSILTPGMFRDLFRRAPPEG